MRLPRVTRALLRRTLVRRLWTHYVRPLAVVVVLLTSFRSVIADWNDVPTGSMNPTILEGDRIAVNKLSYDLRIPYTGISLFSWASPARGDIVVFASPTDGTRLVKRVVAIAGDTVELDRNRLILNGVPAGYARPAAGLLVESAPGTPAHAVAWGAVPTRQASVGPITVPPGHVFVLGDNRDNSLDSRFFGPVPTHRIAGRAFGTAASFDPRHWYAPRWSRFFAGLE